MWQLSSIWCFQKSSESTIIPRYLTKSFISKITLVFEVGLKILIQGMKVLLFGMDEKWHIINLTLHLSHSFTFSSQLFPSDWKRTFTATVIIIIINVQGQTGNCPLQSIRKWGPIMNQAGSNYVNSVLDINFLQILVIFSPFVFS